MVFGQLSYFLKFIPTLCVNITGRNVSFMVKSQLFVYINKFLPIRIMKNRKMRPASG